jgi:hypothetical protein
MTLFMGDDNLDLGEVCASIRFIYGSSFECNFQNLITTLMQTGLGLTEAICGILSSKYGLYYEWRQTVVTLETGLAEGGLPRPDVWSLG